MGLCFESIMAIAFLKKQGLLKDVDRMVELGNQHVRDYRKDVLKLLKENDINCKPAQTTADFYRAWGVKNYTAIDLNGEDGALEYDLNTLFTNEWEKDRTFALVTNFGTTEHCFNQAIAFENIHNLTKVGGYMAHALPAHGWDGHCFFRYDKNFFYDLAQKCDYEVLFLQHYSRPITWKKYFRMVKKNFPLSTRNNRKAHFERAFSRDTLLTVVMRKRGTDFSYPIQGMYSELNEKLGNH